MTTKPATAQPAATYEVRGAVAIITLNRPAALNAVDSALSVAAGDALRRADQDPAVRVAVLTGAGRAFCAGADLKELAKGRSIDDPEHPERGFAGLVRNWVDIPTIAAVNGYAMGGGTEILLACDLAVIDETASLGLPEVRRGLFAAAGGVLRLQRQVPKKIALEISLTGQPVAAVRAYELGLVNRVAPAGQALDVALDLATTIAANAPVAVRETKKLLHTSVDAGSDWESEVWRRNREAAKVVFSSDDAREGPIAFAERRIPRWTGR